MKKLTFLLLAVVALLGCNKDEGNKETAISNDTSYFDFRLSGGGQ